MNTETTELFKEWVFYDGECAVCRDWAQRLEERLRRKGVDMVPLQKEWAVELVAAVNEGSADSLSAIGAIDSRGQTVRAPAEMKVLTAHGEVLGGADALIYLASYVWWGKGLRFLAWVPGVRFVLRLTYGYLARHRHCLKGGCRV